MTQENSLPKPDLAPVGARFWSRVSVVWTIPLLALVVSLALAWQSFANRGEVIYVTFTDAAGLTPGESLLKYREVTVGLVESVGFTSDLKSVRVGIRVQNDVIPFIDSEAKFWIVRPQIGFNGISGLNTVLSGVYVEGSWDDKIVGKMAPQYAGLPKPPLATTAGSGTWVTLSADDGGALIEGAPVMFRGIRVGELRNLRLDDSGNGVLIDAFVQAPYNEQLSTTTVFWDTSGFSVSLDSSGVKLNVRSLSSLIQGGVEFNTLLSGGHPILQRQAFRLYSDANTARDSIFTDISTAPVTVSVLLDGSVRGLKLGGDVTYRGLKVGEISNLSVQSGAITDGKSKVEQRIDLQISADKLGLSPEATEAETLDFLDTEIKADNLRARVASTGLFGGTYIIDLAQVADMPPASLNRNAKPFPVIPNAPPAVGDAVASAQGLMTRIGNLPIEEVMTSATQFLNQMTRLAGQDATQELPKKISSLLDDAHAVISSPDTQAVPKSVLKTIDAAGAFFDDLNTAKTIDSIGAAMTSATEAAQAVSDSAVGVPELIDTVNQLGKKAQGLPLEQLTQNSADLIASLNTLAGSQDMAALPKSLSDALASLSSVLTDLQKGGATENLNKTLDSAQKAATSIADATTQVPDLIKRLDGVVASVNQVLAAYGDKSDFNSNTLSALRQIREAAASFEALARTIERNPQAFILGK